MNFIAQVEEHLRDLGTEARKKHPGVKEASERAILTLRSLQSQYVSAVRLSSSTTVPPTQKSSRNNQNHNPNPHRNNTAPNPHRHPTTSLFRSQDVLRPFLLACNYPDASSRLLTIGLNAIQLLIQGDAVCPGDGVHIARVLAIQAAVCAKGSGGSSHSHSNHSYKSPYSLSAGGSMMMNIATGGGVSGSSSGRTPKDDEFITMRVLQTLTMVIASRSLELSEEVLSQALTVCLVMITGNAGKGDGVPVSSSKPSKSKRGTSSADRNSNAVVSLGGNGKVRHAAAGTLRQILSLTFDRASEDTSSIPATDEPASGSGANNTDVNSNRQSKEMLAQIRYAAARAFADLCALSENRAEARQLKGLTPRSEINGPFSLGLGSGRTVIPPPPRATCFEFLDMILEKKYFLFLTDCDQNKTSKAAEGKGSDEENKAEGKGSDEENKAEGKGSDEENKAEGKGSDEENKAEGKGSDEENKAGDLNYTFPVLLREKACPLVATFLFSEANFCSADSSGNSTDFALLMRSTHLASTIINTFVMVEELEGECHILLNSLIGFVSSSTEAYRKKDNFEDGYVYSISSALEKEGSTSSWRAALSNSDHPKVLIPNNLLWRSAFALEAIYSLTVDQVKLLHLHLSYGSEQHRPFVGQLSQAVSNFAITATLNKRSILGVVAKVEGCDFGRKRDLNNIHPQVFARSKDIVKSFDAWDSSESSKQPNHFNANHLNANNFNANNNTHSSHLSTDALIPSCDEGEAIWIAYNCILSLISSLEYLSIEKQISERVLESLIDSSFASSLMCLQHFLKRFAGCKILRNRTLKGYISLANATIPLSLKRDKIQRRTVLNSLCKLSLPLWGKWDGLCQLKNHHVDSLLSLLYIIHSNHDSILQDWDMVLSTLEQLSALSISSSKLSDEGYRNALCISSSLARLSSFSTCLSPESLQCFVEALVNLSHTSDVKSSVLANDAENSMGDMSKMDVGVDGMIDEVEEEDNFILDQIPAHKESFGGKLLGFAGRAFLGGSGNITEGVPAGGPENSIVRVHSSKTFAEDYRQAAFAHLSSSKPSTRKDIFQKLPFSLVALTDVTLANAFRFSAFGNYVTAHLCDLAASSNSADVRAYAMDTLACLITSRLSGSAGPNHTGATEIRPLPVTPEEYWTVTSIPFRIETGRGGSTKRRLSTISPLTQAELLLPLCKTISTTDQKDAAEAGLSALHIILEGAGHNLAGDAWPILIEAITALSGDNSSAATSQSPDRSSSSWAGCSTLAFRCLKLIVDDFLDQFPSPPDPSSDVTRAALLDCCASFGSSTHDVNTSLTATGMLWTIADQDPTPSSLDRVLSKLAFLACDHRAEVRNCSVNTLFSCVVGLGHRFSSDQWRECLRGTIFGVLEKVASHGEEKQPLVATKSSSAPKKDSARYQVNVHHSRDSVVKQWLATQVLTLRGLERVLRQFFTKLLATASEITPSTSNKQQPWFQSTWSQIVEVALRCATLTGGRETLDLRLAGTDVLVLCNQLSCRRGIAAAIPLARVGTNMQVVNGALRSVRAENAKTKEALESTASESDEILGYRLSLYRNAFIMLERLIGRLLDESLQPPEEEANLFIESALLQVLTKLSTGLTKLYECCKDDEFTPLPPEYSIPDHHHEQQLLLIDNGLQDEDINFERRFVRMVHYVAISAVGDSGSKYLTQAQRTALDLLRSMISRNSDLAFETLAEMGGNSFFCKLTQQNDNDSDVGSTQSEPACELVEYEAAKTVAKLFREDGVAHRVKAYVLSNILHGFLEKRNNMSSKTGADTNSSNVSTNDEESADMTNDSLLQAPASFHLLLPVVTGGLDAAAHLERKQSEQNLLTHLWQNMMDTLSILLSPMDLHNTYTPHTKEILGILNSSVTHSPDRIYVHLGNVLSMGAERALDVATFHSYSENAIYTTCADDCKNANNLSNKDLMEHFHDGLKVFKECLVSLGKCHPQSEELRTIAETTLKETVMEIDKQSNATHTAGLESVTNVNSSLNDVDIDIEVALIVCEAVQNGIPQLKELALAIFPLVCRLTSSENVRLRKGAGEMLACVDLEATIHGALEVTQIAEKRAQEAEEKNVSLEQELTKISAENKELKKRIESLMTSMSIE